MDEEREIREQSLYRHRRAFLVMLLALVMCIVMASATTLAIFTSDLNDGKIGINASSGTIDVDIIDDASITLVGDSLDFMSADRRQRDAIFFEPGCTYITESFRITNKGSVNINFRMYISNDPGTDMLEFERAFELFITDRTDNLNYAERITTFKASLAPGQTTKKYYLVARMKEEAGNAFQNAVYSGIGITVHAVQGNVEIY